MKPTRLIPVLAIFLAGCHGCNNQSEKKETTDTVTTNITIDSTAETNIPASEPIVDTISKKQPNTSVQTPGSGTIPRDPAPPVEKPDPDPGGTKNVSQYIIPTPKFSAGANGISQATVTVKNTHSSISYQKVIIEVVVTGPNDYMRSNLFTVVNLAPGESKQVTVPDSPQGSGMNAKVVRATQSSE